MYWLDAINNFFFTNNKIRLSESLIWRRDESCKLIFELGLIWRKRVIRKVSRNNIYIKRKRSNVYQVDRNKSLLDFFFLKK